MKNDKGPALLSRREARILFELVCGEEGLEISNPFGDTERALQALLGHGYIEVCWAGASNVRVTPTSTGRLRILNPGKL